MRRFTIFSAAAAAALVLGSPALPQPAPPVGGAGAADSPAGPPRMEVAPGPIGRAPLPEGRPGVGDLVGPAPGQTGNPLLADPTRRPADRAQLRFGVGGGQPLDPDPDLDGDLGGELGGDMNGAAAEDPLTVDPAAPGVATEPGLGAPMAPADRDPQSPDGDVPPIGGAQ
jgi:hypothetical protein